MAGDDTSVSLLDLAIATVSPQVLHSTTPQLRFQQPNLKKKKRSFFVTESTDEILRNKSREKET